MKEEEQRKNEPGRGAGFYTAILPTELPTELKIIFSWAEAFIFVGNCRQYFLNFALNF
jgi:hypothetical protein